MRLKLPLFATVLVLAAGAAWPPAWLAPTEPFHIVDDIYYVGSAGLGAYLFTTSDGHVLLDGGLPETAAQIEANVEKLGFRLADVKILLNSHAHFDHSGGLAELKRKSGALLWAHEGDVSALEGGFYLGSEDRAEWRAPPVDVDRRLKDGDAVELGGRTLTLHHTPGHSRGCSSWGTTGQVAGEPHEVLVFCSATVAANRLSGPPQYGGIVEDYRATFAKAKTMRVDVPLAPHPEFFDLLEKRDTCCGSEDDCCGSGLQIANPFVDPTAFPALIAELERDFERALAEQQGE